MTQAIHIFLLAFPALFSIVNPLSGALIFAEVTNGRDDRPEMARQVAIYSLMVMVVTLWAGSFVMAFFGITLAALRVAGGLVVALSGWNLLNTPERHEARKQEQKAVEPGDDITMFPLTIPLTTGPGTISVAVALGAGHPPLSAGLAWFLLGVTLAAAAMAATIWVAYRSADRIVRRLGPRGSRIITRLAAFLLLCIGVQILITGVQDVLAPLMAVH